VPTQPRQLPRGPLSPASKRDRSGGWRHGGRWACICSSEVSAAPDPLTRRQRSRPQGICGPGRGRSGNILPVAVDTRTELQNPKGPAFISPPSVWGVRCQLDGTGLRRPRWCATTRLARKSRPTRAVRHKRIRADLCRVRQHDNETTAIVTGVLDAVRRTGRRAIVSEGGGPTATSVFDHVFVFEIVPHRWLFRRLAAVIHHAGAGALGPALSAGAPQIIVPFITDQFFWAWSPIGRRAPLATVRNGL
jgi:hypothetical protein